MNKTDISNIYLVHPMKNIKRIANELVKSAEQKFSAAYLSIYNTEEVRENTIVDLEYLLLDQGCSTIRIDSGNASEFDLNKLLKALDTTSKSVIFVYGTHVSQIDMFFILGSNKARLVDKQVAILFFITPQNILKFKVMAPHILEIHDETFDTTETGIYEEGLHSFVETVWAESENIDSNLQNELDKFLLSDENKFNGTSNPETTSTWLNSMLVLGIINWRRGNLEKAEQYLKKAIIPARYSNDHLILAELYNALAFVETHQGNFEQAIKSYKKAIASAPNQISAWNNLGYLCIKVERNDEALFAFQKAIDQNTKDPLSWNGLGKVYFQLGYFEDAITAFENAINLASSFSEPWEELGDSFAELEKDSDAENAYRHALEINKNNAFAWIKLAKLKIRQNKLEQAILIYEQAIATGVNDYKVWNELGLAKLNIKSFTDAENAFLKSIELNSDFSQGYNNLATAYISSGKFEKAINASKQCLELTKNDADKAAAFETMANAYRLSNNYEMSLKYLQIADHLKDYSANTVPELMAFSQGTVNHEQTDLFSESPANLQLTDHKISLYNNSDVISTSTNPGAYEYKIAPTESVAYSNPMFCSNDTGTYFQKEPPMNDKYVSITDKDSDIDNPVTTEKIPSNMAEHQINEARLWNAKGNLHFENNEFSEAINAYNKAIQLDQSFGWPYSNLALVYLNLNRFPESIVLYQKSISLLNTNQEKSAVWNRLGSIYRRINDCTKAENAYQKADELYPGNPDHSGITESGSNTNPNGDLVSWSKLGELFFDSGNYKEAENAFIQDTKTQPNSSPTLSKLGMTFTFQGRYEEAISIYQKAIELASDNAEKSILFNRLGNVYRRLNKQDKALEAYQNAVVLAGAKSKLLTRTRFSLLSNCYSN